MTSTPKVQPLAPRDLALMRLALKGGAFTSVSATTAAQLLASVRKAKPLLTQDQLAAKAGVSRATINRLEKGHLRTVALDVIEKLVRELDTKPARRK